MSSRRTFIRIHEFMTTNQTHANGVGTHELESTLWFLMLSYSELPFSDYTAVYCILMGAFGFFSKTICLIRALLLLYFTRVSIEHIGSNWDHTIILIETL